MSEQGQVDESAAPSRRSFVASTLATAATALLPRSTLAAETTNHPPASAAIGPRPEDLAPEAWDEVRARYANLLRVYGDRISQEERQRLLHILTTNVRMLTAIRKFVVQNGDASACTLRLEVPQSRDGQRSA